MDHIEDKSGRWYCSDCGDGPKNLRIELSCVNCGQRLGKRSAISNIGEDLPTVSRTSSTPSLNSKVEPNDTEQRRRLLSSSKPTRDLLPTSTGSSKPIRHSIFNTLILDDDPLDGSRSLRKRKASSEGLDIQSSKTKAERKTNPEATRARSPSVLSETSIPSLTEGSTIDSVASVPIPQVLAKLFVDDDVLEPLFDTLTLSSDTGERELQKFIKGLLAHLAAELQVEARDPVQKLVSKYIKKHCSRISENIYQLAFRKEVAATDLTAEDHVNELLLKLKAQQNLQAKESTPTEDESDNEDEPPGLRSELQRLTTFICSSQAMQNLRIKFDDFVSSKIKYSQARSSRFPLHKPSRARSDPPLPLGKSHIPTAARTTTPTLQDSDKSRSSPRRLSENTSGLEGSQTPAIGTSEESSDEAYPSIFGEGPMPRSQDLQRSSPSSWSPSSPQEIDIRAARGKHRRAGRLRRRRSSLSEPTQESPLLRHFVPEPPLETSFLPKQNLMGSGRTHCQASIESKVNLVTASAGNPTLGFGTGNRTYNTFYSEVQIAPGSRVEIASKESSRIDGWKRLLESYSGEPWIWWPLNPPRKQVPDGHHRVIWRCACGQRISRDVSNEVKSKVLALLTRPLEDPPGGSLSSGQTVIGSTSGQSLSPANSSTFCKQHGQPTQNSQNTASGPSSSPSCDQSGSGASDQASFSNVFYVLFTAYRGNRLCFTQIDVKDSTDDNKFIDTILQEYRQMIGEWRYWLHPRALSFCSFAKFAHDTRDHLAKQLQPELPVGDDYHYSNKPLDGRNTAFHPPISEHEWYDHLHGRIRYPTTCRCALNRVPKRDRKFTFNPHRGREDIFGLFAECRPSFFRVALWTLFILATGFIVFGWWLATHSGDWQNAGVLLTLIFMALAFLWVPLNEHFNRRF